MNKNLPLLIIAGAALLLAPIVGINIAQDPKETILTGLGLGFVLSFPFHDRLSLALMFGLIGSALTLPIAGKPYMWEVGTVVGVSGVFVAIFGNRLNYSGLAIMRERKLLFLSIFAYALLLLVLMKVHGVGLNVLGGGLSGGRAYLQQATLVMMPFCIAMFRYSDRFWVGLLTLSYFLTAVTWLVPDFGVIYFGSGVARYLDFFALPSDALNFERQVEAGGMRRYQSLSMLGVGGLSLFFLFNPIRKLISPKGVLVYVPIVIGLFVLMTFGGSRRTVVEMVIVVTVLAISQKFLSIQTLVPLSMLATIFAAGLYLAAPMLPMAGQRTLSFLPGISVSEVAKKDAGMTMVLRKQLRAEAFRLIPKHFWAGRGFGVDLDYVVSQGSRITALERHVAKNSFYSGPIGIFVTLGVFGFILFCCIAVSGLRLCWDIMKKVRRQDGSMLNRGAGLIVGKFVASLFVYVFFTGDANGALKNFVPLISMMIGLLIISRREISTERLPASRKEKDALQLARA